MEIHTIGIDLAKTVFHLVGLNAHGEVVVQRKCSRSQSASLHLEPSSVLDRHGGLRWSAFSRPGSSRSRS